MYLTYLPINSYLHTIVHVSNKLSVHTTSMYILYIINNNNVNGLFAAR